MVSKLDENKILQGRPRPCTDQKNCVTNALARYVCGS